MGVPAFFRWLTRKYPSVICDCVEEKAREHNGKKLPVNTVLPNPNGVEFDNLYLDMNGIIHPCTHPEDRPAPKNEDEMMVAIFEFIDRIFAIVRPRRLLYMAIDGVAPRAKMNQQRSRRFRAAKESYEKKEEMERIREELQGRGAYVPEKNKEEHFDSNCITPGTPFMHKLAKCLKYYVHDRLRNDPGWQGIMVILSDANVPGEGEHKIMDYIRKQRAMPDHNPNTHHVLCGADADLIMLGLATHEPYFTIIREEFKPNKPRPCDICGQLGHEMKDCQGLERTKSGENDELPPPVAPEQQFIFVRLYVLREYLARDLAMPNLPFPYDLERAIDDWVFMCFFVGNDFLPHLPSLEIREGAIDRLVNLYKDTVAKTRGWLTDSGFVNLERVQLIMRELGEVEDEIFKKRQQDELEFKRRQKAKKQRMNRNGDRPAWMLGGQFAPRAVGFGGVPAVSNAHQEIHHTRVQSMQVRTVTNQANVDAAVALKAMLRSSTEVTVESSASVNEGGRDNSPVKRKLDDLDSDEEVAHDEVRLWEDGFKERYYESKFAAKATDDEFRLQVAREYVKGLCWVLQYYYQGCPSWNWYFPYHYAPFASDFEDIAVVKSTFEPGTKPFSPLEQLMGVFPAASGSHIPSPWVELMTDPESPIIDFYPEDFKIDLNGKKYAWQGVALLPFVDESRLKDALKSYYLKLTEEEVERNTIGEEIFYVGKRHEGYAFLRGLYEGSGESENDENSFDLNPKLFHGVSGKVLLTKDCVEPGGVLPSPINGLPDLYDCHVVCVNFRNPDYGVGYKFLAVRLAGAKQPDPVLRPRDYDDRSQGPWRPMIGMAHHGQRGHLGGAGHRMLGHNMQRPPRPHGGVEIQYSYQQQQSYQYQGRGPPPQQQYRGQYNSGGYRGGYNQPPNRGGYGPPPDSNGGYGYDQRQRQQGYNQRPRGQGPRPGGPPQGGYRNDNRNSGYGYYTSNYQGNRY